MGPRRGSRQCEAEVGERAIAVVVEGELGHFAVVEPVSPLSEFSSETSGR
jgi:hypothetical protein